MSNSFSFDATAGTSQSTVKPKLEGNNIYTVKIDSVEVKDMVGKKADNMGTVYKTLIIKFSNEDGMFEHTVFEPKPADFERTATEFVNKNGVKEKIPQPSNVESMMLLFKHVIDTFSPAIAKQIDNKERSINAPNWDALRNLIIQILDKGKNNVGQIKLIKDKNGDAKFPGFFAAINRDGAAYVRNNFVGDKVAFTAYETQRINGEATARVTNTASLSTSLLDNQAEDTSLDLNFAVDGL